MSLGLIAHAREQAFWQVLSVESQLLMSEVDCFAQVLSAQNAATLHLFTQEIHLPDVGQLAQICSAVKLPTPPVGREVGAEKVNDGIETDGMEREGIEGIENVGKAPSPPPNEKPTPFAWTRPAQRTRMAATFILGR